MNQSNLNPAIFIVIVVVALGAFFVILRSDNLSNQQANTTAPSEKDDADAEKPSDPAPTPSLGKLTVKAPIDALAFVVKDATGNEVGKGTTNTSTIELPGGDYTVTVTPGSFPPVDINPVNIKGTETTETQLKGFGTLLVTATKEAIKYEVLDLTGNKVGEGETQKSNILLPIGDYSISIEGQTKTGITIKDGEKTDFNCGL